jgi:putative hydrolase of the HAD superfamily
MIGDNPVNDIKGAREKIGAVTLQKLHDGLEIGRGPNAPDAAFHDFAELRVLLARLGGKFTTFS